MKFPPCTFATLAILVAAAGAAAQIRSMPTPGMSYRPTTTPAVAVAAPAAAPVVDRRDLTAACADSVRSAQIRWFVRVTGMPAPSGTAATELRSILAANGFDLNDLEPMPTRNCASLADGPEQPVEQWMLADTNRVQMPIPAN